MWGLHNIFTADAWALTEGEGVTVGVVDTGVQADHEDLAGQVIGGYDLLSHDSVAQDGNGHGTHVAGIIAALANNNKGIIGVAPSAKVVPLRALDDGGSGYMSDVAAAFDYAGDEGLRIVNASLAGRVDVRPGVLETVIAAHPNTLYVVAAGNDAKDNDQPAQASYPCALPQPNIICVAASDNLDRSASFSNYGATTVDLSAPGVSIRSTVPNNRYASKSGTSMAAPHVAGAAALALAANPSATTSQLKWALLSTVDAVPAFVGKSTTAGRLNASAAVAAILGDCPSRSRAGAGPTPPPAVPVETPTPAPRPRPPRRPTLDRPAGRAACSGNARLRARAGHPHPRLHAHPAGGCAPHRPQGRTLAQGRQGQAARHLQAHAVRDGALHRHGQGQVASGPGRAGPTAAATSSRSRASCRPARRSSAGATGSRSHSVGALSASAGFSVR